MMDGGSPEASHHPPKCRWKVAANRSGEIGGSSAGDVPCLRKQIEGGSARSQLCRVSSPRPCPAAVVRKEVATRILASGITDARAARRLQNRAILWRMRVGFDEGDGVHAGAGHRQSRPPKRSCLEKHWRYHRCLLSHSSSNGRKIRPYSPGSSGKRSRVPVMTKAPATEFACRSGLPGRRSNHRSGELGAVFFMPRGLSFGSTKLLRKLLSRHRYGAPSRSVR